MKLGALKTYLYPMFERLFTDECDDYDIWVQVRSGKEVENVHVGELSMFHIDDIHKTIHFAGSMQ